MAARRSRSRWKIGPEHHREGEATEIREDGGDEGLVPRDRRLAVAALRQADVAAAGHQALVPDREVGGSLEGRDLDRVLDPDPEDLDPPDAACSDTDGLRSCQMDAT